MVATVQPHDESESGTVLAQPFGGRTVFFLRFCSRQGCNLNPGRETLAGPGARAERHGAILGGGAGGGHG
jgi:hypothetical protein